MNETLDQRVRALAADSELLQAVSSIRKDGGLAIAIGAAALRNLFKLEIELLESLGNTARDWSLIQVSDGFNPRRVRGCEFHGRVVLGRFNKYVALADGLEVVAGLSGSTIADCVIGNNALIRDVRLLANYVIGEEAIVVDCGRITCRANTAFGNGDRLPLALEGGGREVEVFAEIDVEIAAVVARPGRRRAEVEDYRRAVGDYRNSATSDRGLIGRGARVWGVQRIEDTYVGPMARVDGATQVLRSTLLSTASEPVVVESGSLVVDSLLQWGARVAGLAVVERSVLTEQSRVERHGKVQNSLIGPNSEIAAGEVSSCLLGPFVNCPHQSLLISTFWPDGRGNVGYGANVGSNHTSRAPDQEFRAGEGLFIGLGVNVKFPCDFSRAPYTVVACGVNLPPQKVTLPFSLITAPPGLSIEEQPSSIPLRLNQIRPGWMLYENVYALKRNEAKFRSRNRARRTSFNFAVFRPETAAQMWTALRSLTSLPVVKEFYTERDIPGLGKNFLTEVDRVRAIEAYRFYTRYTALLELKNRVCEAGQFLDSASAILTSPDQSDDWEWMRNLLVQDFAVATVQAGLNLFAESARAIAEKCESNRRKDEIRGERIIDDYSEVHPGADRDRIVKAAFEDAEEADRLTREFALQTTGRVLAPTSI